MTRYGLYGIGGVYNFGCEAIVRGLVSTLKDLDDQCEIVYLTPNLEYDQERLGDLPLAFKMVRAKDSFIKKVVRKGFAVLGAEKRPLRVDLDDLLDGIDVLVSIGGDMYTIPAHLRAHDEYPYYNHLLDVCDRACDRDIPVVLYGASVGPFGDYVKAVEYYKNALRRYALIVCREYGSVDYLHTLGIDENVMFLPDPAFCVASQCAEGDGGSSYIGINLSPLSFAEMTGVEDGRSGTDKALSLVKEILSVFDSRLLFVPHVLSSDPRDDDLGFMRAVYSMLDEDEKQRVDFADCSSGFVGIKAHLRQCSMVVAARMHCAINALHEDIPTIFLSYSQKSRGMCSYVYGSEDWVFSIDGAQINLLNAMKRMHGEREEIRDCVARSLARIDSDRLKGMSDLFKVLKGIRASAGVHVERGARDEKLDSGCDNGDV